MAHQYASRYMPRVDFSATGFFPLNFLLDNFKAVLDVLLDALKFISHDLLLAYVGCFLEVSIGIAIGSSRANGDGATSGTTASWC